MRRLWAAGFLNAVSIGFMPKSYTPREGDQGGYVFEDWELLEYSIVPVPANQDALRLAMKSVGAALLPETPAKDEPAQPEETTPHEGEAPSDEATSETEPIIAAATNDESEDELSAALDQLLNLLPELKEVLI